MHTKLKIILFTIGVAILLSACNKQDQEEIAEKAKQVAVDFMKSEESIDFVPEEVEFTSAIGGGTVWVEGYNEDNPSEVYSVTVNYDDNNYEVGSVATGQEVEVEEE